MNILFNCALKWLDVFLSAGMYSYQMQANFQSKDYVSWRVTRFQIWRCREWWLLWMISLVALGSGLCRICDPLMWLTVHLWMDPGSVFVISYITLRW